MDYDFADQVVIVTSGGDGIGRAAALEAPRLPDREYSVGSGEALTMPQIAAVAGSVLPGLQARLMADVDDVPDRQCMFDIVAIGADLGWHPRYGIARGSVACCAAILAGRAAATST